MNKVRKIVALIFALFLFMENLPIYAAIKDPITVQEYITLLTEELHLDTNKFPEIVINKNKKITRQDAAVLANQAEELLNGVVKLTDNTPNEIWNQVSEDKKQYDRIVKFKRIKDLNKIPKEKRESVLKVFQKGIMIGTGNGTCAQDRTFHGSWLISKEEAKEICSKIANKKLRTKMSPDGQVIRTSKLPKNYKDFSYILESFPNSFYEKKFGYELSTYYAAGGKTRKPIEYKDYTKPINMKNNMDYAIDFSEMADHYLDDWVKKAEENLRLRFNVDYRTVDKEWINALWKTYYQYGDYTPNDDWAMDNRRVNDIKKYISNMKKNKVVIRSSRISVEPSSLYDSTMYTFRVYVKFKLSADNIKITDNIFYGNHSYIENLKEGIWIEKYFEIGLATSNGNSKGSDFAIFNDNLIDMK